MSLEEIRVILKEYLLNTPITRTILAKRIGIALITLQSFLIGGQVRQKVWVKLDKFAQDLKGEQI